MAAGEKLLRILKARLFGELVRHCPPKRVLVIRSSRFGDFINAMPALDILRKACPFSKIVLLTLPSASRISAARTEDMGYLDLLEKGVVDEIIRFSLARIYNLNEMRRLREKISSLSPDMTIIMPFSGENAVSMARKLLFLKAAGIKGNVFGWRVGALKERSGPAHQVFGPLDALSEAGIDFDGRKAVVFRIRKDRAAAELAGFIWKMHGLEGKDTVAVFPGGTYRHKRWPTEKYGALIKALLEEYGVKVVLIGNKKERGLCARLEREGAHNLAGKLDYPGLAEVLRRCRLFIGNDSGPAHLASAVGTRCITIFSSIQPPGIWEPWNSRDLAVREPVPCEYCRSETCCPAATKECINNISVERVLALAGKELGGGARAEGAAKGVKRWLSYAR